MPGKEIWRFFKLVIIWSNSYIYNNQHFINNLRLSLICTTYFLPALVYCLDWLGGGQDAPVHAVEQESSLTTSDVPLIFLFSFSITTFTSFPNVGCYKNNHFFFIIQIWFLPWIYDKLEMYFCNSLCDFCISTGT